MSHLSQFNRVQVMRFYNILKEDVSKHGFQAHQIYNLDESGITVVQSPSKVVAKRGSKQVGRSVPKKESPQLSCAL